MYKNNNVYFQCCCFSITVFYIMGINSSTDTTKPSPILTILSDGSQYDMSKCKPGCIERVYTERKDPMFMNALKGSSIFDLPILLFISIKKDKDSFFSLLNNNDVMLYIIRLVIYHSIQERIIKSMRLDKPWKITNIYSRDDPNFINVHAPSKCVYSGHSCYINNIKCGAFTYNISNYFWVDDIYHSDICKCPLYYEKIELCHKRKRKSHWLERYGVENTNKFY